MTDSRSGRAPWPTVIAGFAVGPAIAGLHEAGLLSLGPSATLWPIGSVALAAAVGIGTGVRLAYRGPRPIGVLVALPNVLVFLFYGFLLLFFGLGGSR